MENLIFTIDAMTQTAMHVFAVSILWIIVAGQRARRKDPVDPEPRGRWGRVNNLLLWPHREYALRKRNHLVIWINLGSAAIFLSGFLLLALFGFLGR